MQLAGAGNHERSGRAQVLEVSMVADYLGQAHAGSHSTSYPFEFFDSYDSIFSRDGWRCVLVLNLVLVDFFDSFDSILFAGKENV